MPPQTPLAVAIAASLSRRRDVDNIIKPILDALESAGVVPDDRYVDRILARRERGGGTDEVTVDVSILDNPA